MIPNYEGLDTLRARGLRLTRPRRLILDVVRATDAHPTAAFVYRKVRRCCGMPYLDGGAVGEAKTLIRDNVGSLAAAVREGCEIVVPGPTCSYMLKQEYPWLDGSDERSWSPRTREISSSTSPGSTRRASSTRASPGPSAP
jgi:Fe-S oxidoreductase